MTELLRHTVPAQRPFDDSELRAALDLADIPTLLPVLYQLTGDRRWLREPFRPGRARGIAGSDAGGLAPELQSEVRRAALDAVSAWGRGRPAAVPDPDATTVVEMLSASMGEPVPEEFGPMSTEMLRSSAGQPPERRKIPEVQGLRVVVIGAGVSGISAAAELQRAGTDFVVFEKNTEVGGTWWENRYPGAGVDTPSYVYTFSGHPRKWSTFYGRRDEVETYLSEVADELRIRDRIKFGTEVISAAYDDQQLHWTVTVREADGAVRSIEADAVISAVGLLNRPKVPQITGADSFPSVQCHSAAWPDGLDVTGLRVAVIGSGASAMQVVPAIADKVERLTVFQRSPQWIAPAPEYFGKVPESVHWLMDRVPFYYAWYRLRLSWMTNDRLYPALLIDPAWPDQELSINAVNDAHRRFFTRYIESELGARPDLLEKSLPDYPPYGKRMLLDNGWYAALRKPNVELVTDPIIGIETSEIVTSTKRRFGVDVIVYATGFEAQKMLYPMDIRGRDGIALRDVWGDDDAKAYLGISVPDFPNLFVMYGPNLNLGHGGSYMYFGELQARYIVDLLAATAQYGARTVEVRRDVHDDYNKRVDDAHAGMIWSHRGMQTWYRNAAGRVVTNSPWRVVDYWQMIREVDPDEYEFRTHGAPA